MIYIGENMRPLPDHLFFFYCYTTHYRITSACPLSSTTSIEIRQKRKPEDLELGVKDGHLLRYT